MNSDSMRVKDAAPGCRADSHTRDISPGYKRTEAGMIPCDWEAKRLGDLSTMSSGGTPDSSIARYYNGGIPWVSISDMTRVNRVIMQPERTLSREGLERSAAEIFPQGTVLYAMYASIGECSLAGVPLCSSQAILGIRPSRLLANEFLYYWLVSQKESIRSRGQHGTQANLNKEIVQDLVIATPPLREQRAIAEALSEVDCLLGSLGALIAKKRAIKQTAMQQLLTGKYRLPGFIDTGMRTTEIGQIPSEWSLVPLSRLVDPTRGIRYGIVQPGNYDPNGRYMIRGQDYSEAKGWAHPKDVFRVSPRIEEKYRNARVRQGDLIMTIVGYCGHVEMIPVWLDGANLTQTTARIAIKSEQATPTFCKYFLQSHVGKRQVAVYLKGGAQPGLNCGDVEQFLVCLPPVEEQVAIATLLSDMDAEIVALEARRDKTRAIKQGMMQQLLTGRVRLVEPGAAA